MLSDFLTTERFYASVTLSMVSFVSRRIQNSSQIHFELDEAARLLGWAMSFLPRKLDRLSINITSNVFSTLEAVTNNVECSYQMESMKNTKNYSGTVRLQPPPLY